MVETINVKKLQNNIFRMDDGRSHASSGTKRENKLVDKEVEALIEVIFELLDSDL